jgi:hypothetical protein
MLLGPLLASYCSILFGQLVYLLFYWLKLRSCDELQAEASAFRPSCPLTIPVAAVAAFWARSDCGLPTPSNQATHSSLPCDDLRYVLQQSP